MTKACCVVQRTGAKPTHDRSTARASRDHDLLRGLHHEGVDPVCGEEDPPAEEREGEPGELRVHGVPDDEHHHLDRDVHRGVEPEPLTGRDPRRLSHSRGHLGELIHRSLLPRACLRSPRSRVRGSPRSGSLLRPGEPPAQRGLLGERVEERADGDPVLSLLGPSGQRRPPRARALGRSDASALLGERVGAGAAVVVLRPDVTRLDEPSRAG